MRRKTAARATVLLLAPASRFALVTVALVGIALLAGCGGGSDQASSSTPVDQLLRETFSGHKNVKSGKLAVTVNIDVKGGSSSFQGPSTLRLGGPFESQGKGKLPKFAMDLSLQGGGQSVDAGVTSTGDKGYVRFQGADYVVSDQVFQQFKKGYEQAQSQAGSGGQGQSLASLGIDPRRWLINPRNAGDATVGDTDTIKITGGVDVPKLLDDVDTLLQRTRSLGGSAAQNIPGQLTEQEKQQAAKAVKNLSVQIYTGKDDKILRRMVIALSVQGPQGSSAAGQGADVRLDVQLTDLNQGQDISAPSNPKPFAQLLNSLGALGLGSPSTGSGSSGGASAGNLQKYSQCIEKAGSDASKARKCANLLTP
jgi:hypothetical protein